MRTLLVNADASVWQVDDFLFDVMAVYPVDIELESLRLNGSELDTALPSLFPSGGACCGKEG